MEAADWVKLLELMQTVRKDKGNTFGLTLL